MKRLLLIVTAVVLAVAQMAAAPVDAQTARAKASRFVTSIASEGRHKAPAKSSDIKLVLTQASKAIAGQAAYYVFNTNDSYIICAHRQKPSLGGASDEFAKLTSANRRSVIFADGELTDCAAPTE